MTIHLYQQTISEAFLLCTKSFLRMGFIILLADEKNGIISARKNGKFSGHWIFLDGKITAGASSVNVRLVSSEFQGSTGIFIADTITETLFLETFHDLLRIQPPDNPMRLSHQDYALAVGF